MNDNYYLDEITFESGEAVTSWYPTSKYTIGQIWQEFQLVKNMSELVKARILIAHSDQKLITMHEWEVKKEEVNAEA